MTDSDEYNIWAGIKQRCLNPKSTAYYRYGGRGISICEEWINSFEAFYGEIGPRPSREFTVERINNNKGYEPGNVRWATVKEQARNRSTNVLVTLNGETKCATEWADIFKMPVGTILSRVKRGWSHGQVILKGKEARRLGDINRLKGVLKGLRKRLSE